MFFKLNKAESFIQYNGLNDDYIFDLIGENWILNQVKTDRFIYLQADASLISKTWHGESEIANHITLHNEKNTPPGWPTNLMFDNNVDTYWLAEGYFNGPKKVIVTFKVIFIDVSFLDVTEILETSQFQKYIYKHFG